MRESKQDLILRLRAIEAAITKAQARLSKTVVPSRRYRRCLFIGSLEFARLTVQNKLDAL